MRKPTSVPQEPSKVHVPHRRESSVWVILLSVILLAVLLRIVAFSGYAGADDGWYLKLANEMAQGEFRVSRSGDERLLRVGVIAPAALSIKIVGRPDEKAFTVYPFALSLLGVVLAYFLARVLLGDRAALIAAALQAIVPLDTRYASILFSDLPAAFWGNVGILLLFLGGARASLSSKTALGLLGGLAFGVSWLTRGTIVYLLPFVAGYLAWLCFRSRRNLALAISAGAGLFAIFAGETLVYYVHTGDWLYRYHETERHFQIFGYGFFTEGSQYGWIAGRYWSALLRRWLFEGPVALFLSRYVGFIPGVAMISVLYALARRVRSLTLPALWFVSLIVLFNFGSTSLHGYSPYPLNEQRYLYPIYLPAIILVAGLLDILIQKPSDELARERLFWGSILAAGLVAICFFGVYRYASEGMGSAVARAVAKIVEPRDKVFTDTSTARDLSFFWGSLEQMANVKNFEGMNASAVPAGAYVLINRDKIDYLRSTYGYKPPDFFDRIPQQWAQKWSGYSGVLYRVTGK